MGLTSYVEDYCPIHETYFACNLMLGRLGLNFLVLFNLRLVRLESGPNMIFRGLLSYT